MSSVNISIGNSDKKHASIETQEQEQEQSGKRANHGDYKGFVAGVFSGVAKLSGKYLWLFSQQTLLTFEQLVIREPFQEEQSFSLANVRSFDTIKVRLQTSEKAQFRGPLQCLLQTVRKEGASGLYKGATPPLLGWMFMDSL